MRVELVSGCKEVQKETQRDRERERGRVREDEVVLVSGCKEVQTQRERERERGGGGESCGGGERMIGRTRGRKKGRQQVKG